MNIPPAKVTNGPSLRCGQRGCPPWVKDVQHHRVTMWMNRPLCSDRVVSRRAVVVVVKVKVMR